jgi:hypothetical protein
MAIQMNAVRFADSVGLIFTTVLDQMRLGMVGEDEEVREVTDRAYWEERGSKATVAMADELLEILRRFDPRLVLKYNKFYIGLAVDDKPRNFVIFKPQKTAIRIEPRIQRTDETQALIESAGLDVLDYDAKWNRYRIRLQKGEIGKQAETLRKLFTLVHQQAEEGGEP